ncbi:MAG TPA: hypothetical protein VKQ54_11615 [Caulobacteraceae bacterium]|nr:hypothetical protein [Caulobacteraceae bacterium]
MLVSKGKPLAAPPAPVDPEAVDGADAPDPSVALAEEHLRFLAELRQAGMTMVRILTERTEIDLQSAKMLLAKSADPEAAGREGPPGPPPLRDPAGDLARLSRCLRLTVVLEGRIAKRLQGLRAGLAREREARREDAASRAGAEREARHQAAREKVEDLVTEAILAGDGDEAEALELAEALDERLEDDDAYMNLEDRPLREVIAQMCADLCIEVDWSRWTGEGWTPPAFPFRPKFSPFNRPSRTRIMPEAPAGANGARQASGP